MTSNVIMASIREGPVLLFDGALQRFVLFFLLAPLAVQAGLRATFKVPKATVDEAVLRFRVQLRKLQPPELVTQLLMAGGGYGRAHGNFRRKRIRVAIREFLSESGETLRAKSGSVLSSQRCHR